MEKKKIYVCKQCGKKFIDYISLNRVYCSKKCQYQAKSKYKLDFSQIKKLYESGYSVREISIKLKIPESVLYQFLKKKGYKLRSHKEAYIISLLKGKIKRTKIKIPKEKWKLGYLAGLIDGEGSVYVGEGFSKTRRIPEVKVTNTNKKMIEWIVKGQ